MANKNINKFIAFAAITGAAIAAGIAYFKHKNEIDMFNDDLDEEEEEDFDFPLPAENDDSSAKREYVSLNIDKESNAEGELTSVEKPNTEEIKSSDSNTAPDAEESEEVKTV